MSDVHVLEFKTLRAVKREDAHAAEPGKNGQRKLVAIMLESVEVCGKFREREMRMLFLLRGQEM